MAFNDLIRLQDDVEFYLCLNINDEFHYSTAPFSKTAPWKNRILDVGNINTAVDLGKRQMEVRGVEVVLDDSLLDIRAKNPRLNWRMKPASLTLFVGHEGVYESRVVYSGYVETGNIKGRKYEIKLLPGIQQLLGDLQRVVTKQRFPNALESDIGMGMNIALAYGSATSGDLLCPIVDTAAPSGNIYIGLVQHNVYVCGVERDRNGTRTSIVPTVAYVQDGMGGYYFRGTIVAADYQAGDKFYALPMAMTPVGGGLTDWANPIRAIYEALLAFTRFTADDLDSSWADAEDYFDYLASTTTFSFIGGGFGIPLTPGPPEARQSSGWQLLQELLGSIGYTAFIKNTGQLSLARIAPWLDDDPVRGIDAAMIIGDPDHDEGAIKIWNELTFSFDNSQNQNEAYEENTSIFENADSQAAFGLHAASKRNRYCRTAINAGHLAPDEMKLHSGAYCLSTITTTMAGLDDRIEIGSVIEVNHEAGHQGAWQNQRLQVTGIKFSWKKRTVEISGIPMGDPIGTITEV